MSKRDPKHGRWILPLIIAGLIGFTYLFVNALPPGTADNGDGEPEAGATTTTASGNGGEENGDGGNGATTTQAPPTSAFLTLADDFATRGAGLAEEAQTINDDWDNGEAEFAATRDAITDLGNSTSDLATEITDADVPPDAADAWTTVIAAAEDMDTAAADMLDGLVNAEGSEERLTALDDYGTAAADLATGLDLARTAVGG